MGQKKRSYYAIKYIHRLDELAADQIQTELNHADLRQLSPSHFEIISYLMRRGPNTMTHIADQIERDKSTVTVLVRKLESLALVDREENPQDGRSYMIRLTRKGKDLRPLIVNVYRHLRDEMQSNLTYEEEKTLYELLEKMYINYRAKINERGVAAKTKD